jgi:hypothetical protein
MPTKTMFHLVCPEVCCHLKKYYLEHILLSACSGLLPPVQNCAISVTNVTNLSSLHSLGKQLRFRSAGTSVPPDQELNCLLPGLLGYIWPRWDQCISRSKDMDVPAHLHLNWLHMPKNEYIGPGIINTSTLLALCIPYSTTISFMLSSELWNFMVNKLFSTVFTQ